MIKYKCISAKDNHLIRLVSLLQKSSKARKDNGLFVLEGLRLCDDARTCGVGFQTLIVSDLAASKLSAEIDNFEGFVKEFVKVPDELFKKISDTVTPQGILAIARIPDNNTPVNTSGRYVALEHITDPSNIGAIARTAEALGISGLIISNNSCDIYSPKVLRASMGTILRLPVYLCDDIPAFLQANRLRGFACIPDKSADLCFGEYRFSGGDTVIIGNEANGILESTIKKSYKTVNIKMSGKVESLNAANAAAIAIWELIK